MAGPAPGPERVAHDRGAGRGEDAGADRGADAERGQVPLAERALEPAALQDVVLAILHGLPERRAGSCIDGPRSGDCWIACVGRDQELRLPGSVKVTVVVPATVVPSGVRAGVKRKARMTSSNFRA